MSKLIFWDYFSMSLIIICLIAFFVIQSEKSLSLLAIAIIQIPHLLKERIARRYFYMILWACGLIGLALIVYSVFN